MAKSFVGVDWGTSSCRAYLIDGAVKILEEVDQAGAGALNVSSEGQEGFQKALDALLKKGKSELWLHPDTSLLMCGMVGSRLGWKEVPYVSTPASLPAVARGLVDVSALDGRSVKIVPGLTHTDVDGYAPDVMRGEETQLFGAASCIQKGSSTQGALFVLPGTHSKWAYMKDGKITYFKTRMSGELFDVLSKHLILGKLMSPYSASGGVCWDAFEEGLQQSGKDDGFLHNLFTCRTEGLVGKFTATALPSYLSGLLIGHEVREVIASRTSISGLTIVGSDQLSERYRRAIAFIGGTQASVVPGSLAIAHGLSLIMQQLAKAAGRIELNQKFTRALDSCPVVAILRGLKPEDAISIGDALIDAGIRIMEVPLNSPQPLQSIGYLAAKAPADVIIGAGTVLTPQDVSDVAEAGGKLIVSPNMDESVVRRTKELGLLSLPGCFTPTEAFAALSAGADGVKAFPGEAIPPQILKAWRAVLPKESRVIPTGGVTVENMGLYWDAGVNGFGIGSNIFKPGEAASVVKAKAEKFVARSHSLLEERATKKLRTA